MLKISIIIPVYNVSEYLKKCLDSIANQTLTDFEAICVDDGSTDNSLAILNEYAQKDNRFIIVSQKNQGQGVARNEGLKLAKGKYVLFVDPDDWIEQGALETLYNFSEEKSAQVVRFDFNIFDEAQTGQTQLTSFKERIKDAYNYDLSNEDSFNWKIFKKNCLLNFAGAIWIYFYNRQFILDNNLYFLPTKLCEDQLFSLGSILCPDNVYYLEKHLYTYRQRRGSVCHKVYKDNLIIIDNINKFKNFLIDKGLYEELKNEFFDYAKHCLKNHYLYTPKNLIKEYEKMSFELVKSCNPDVEFKTWQKELKKVKSYNRNFMQNIFSVKNITRHAINYKVITILGICFHIEYTKKTKRK